MSGLSIGPKAPSTSSLGSAVAFSPTDGALKATETAKPESAATQGELPVSKPIADQQSSLSTRSVRTGSDAHVGVDAERDKVRTAFVGALKEKYGQSISDAVARHMVSKLNIASASDKNQKIASEIAQHVVEILKARKAGTHQSASTESAGTQTTQNPLEQHQDQVRATQRSLAQSQVEQHQGVLKELHVNLESTRSRLRELHHTSSEQASPPVNQGENNPEVGGSNNTPAPRSINVREMARLYDQERELSKRIDQETALLAASLESVDRLDESAANKDTNAEAQVDSIRRPRSYAFSETAPIVASEQAAQSTSESNEADEKAQKQSASTIVEPEREPLAGLPISPDSNDPPAAQSPKESSKPAAAARQRSASENSLTRHESENAAAKAPDLAAHRAALKPTKTNAHKDEVKVAELTEAQQMQEAILNKARKRSDSGPV